MEIKLGTLDSETIFYFANVVVRDTKVMSQHTMLDGSYKVQEAPLMKKVFDITFVKVRDLIHPNADNLRAEYLKGTTLNLIIEEVSYTVKWVGDLALPVLGRNADHGTSIVLVEV